MGEITKTNNYTGFFYKAFRNILLVSVPLTIISAIILSLPHSSAYSSSTDSVALTLPSACTISASIVTPHNITLVNGQKQDDIGDTKINAYCNDNNGYFIYAIGSSNDIAGNTDLISSVNSSYNIHTGIYPTTLTTSTPSSWAMKLSSNNAPTIIDGYDSYSLIPETDTIVAFRTSGTSMDVNTDLTGSYFNTTYQIYANSIQPAGTYLGKVKYTMTHPYDASQIPNIENAFDIAGVDKVNVPGVGSYYAMQDMTDRICNLVGVRGELSATQLVDIRDNKLYWVAKLDDNNCWMTQNLDLDLSHEVALTSETSDIDPDTYNTGVYTSDNGYSQNGNIVSWLPSTLDSNNVQRADTIPMNWTSATTATISGWTNDGNKPYSANAGDRYKYTDDIGNETVYTSFEACRTATNDAKGCQHMHIGNYYNWTVSVATNNTNGYNSNTLVNSICPKNWDLPANGKYGAMMQAQTVFSGSNNTYDTDGFLKIRTSPLYFVRSGFINNGSVGNVASTGYYWSSTAYTTAYAYYLNFNNSNIYPELYWYYGSIRGQGFSIRCVAK